MDKATLTLLLFAIVVAITLGITVWAASQTHNTTDFWAAGRKITGWQNGFAIAGDYMSAASFLGIAGLIAFNGYDGFMYSVGWLVAYLTVLFVIAEPMRNTGKFTMADVLAYRLSPVPVRAAAAFSTLAVSASYMMAQMIGAGSLIKVLVPHLDRWFRDNLSWLFAKNTFGIPNGLDPSITVVGVLMMVYVIAGGMVATTWVQIVKAVLLMGGATLLTFLVLIHFSFNLGSFFDAIANVKGGSKGNIPFTDPGILYQYGKQHWYFPNKQSGFDTGIDLALVENISLGMALILGTAGLPHILMRFFTVPNAQAARSSVAWAMGLIGSFYIMTTFLGFGAATLIGKAKICAAVLNETSQKCAPSALNSNLAAPFLAKVLGAEYFGATGGIFFLALISAVAFTTILAVVAGLTLAAASAFSHDVYVSIIRGQHASEAEQVLMARLTAALVGILSIWLASKAGATTNAAALVAGLAFVIASAANLPVILLTLFWRRFNTLGAVLGLVGGTLITVWLYAIGPGFSLPAPKNPAFQLSNVGIVSIPAGFLLAFLGTWLGELVGASRYNRASFSEIEVRSETGIGAELIPQHVPA